MLFVGVDPDMHTMPIAFVDETLKPVFVHLCRCSDSTGPQAVQAILRSLCDFITPSRWPLGDNHVSGACVENQELYLSGPSRTRNPRDIMHLAQVAGGVLHWMIYTLPSAQIHFPKPVEWKGSVDKLVHQKRILYHAGVAQEQIVVMGGAAPDPNEPHEKDRRYCSVKDATAWCDATPSEWKHVVDAIGLAQYAAKQYKFGQEKTHYLNKAKGIA